MVSRLDAMKDRALNYMLLVEILLDDPIRVFSGFGEYTSPDGRVWLGTGQVGFFTPVQTSEEVSATEFSVGVRITDTVGEDNFGAFADAVDADMEVSVKGKSVKAYIGVFTETGELVENTLTLWAYGIGSTLETAITRDAVEFSIKCETRLAAAFPSKSLFLNDADQRSLFPGDRGLEFTTALASSGRIGTWSPGF